MPDPQGPEPGTPEYDWLYGSQKKQSDDDATQMIRPPVRQPQSPAPAQPPHDATRVIPRQAPPAAQTPYAAPSAQPPGSPPRTRPMQTPPMQPPPQPVKPAPAPPPVKAQRKRRKLHPIRWAMVLILAWIVYLVAVPYFAVKDISTIDAFPSGDRPAEQDGTTYLIVGSDKADDLSDEQRKALRTGPRGGTNTDTIMVLHTGGGPNVLMSIPRDTLVQVPGYGKEMINSAFESGGAPLLVETVEQFTGIRVDHYVEMGFGSVINTVDALDGIEVCPTINMKDKDARLNIKKGCQDVDGETALAYSRSRKVTPMSDLDRVARQREVVSALGDKVLSPSTFINPFRYWRFNHAAAKSIRVSEGTGLFDLARFARAMTSIDGKKGKTCTMPNLVAPEDENRVVPDQPRANRLFDHIAQNETDDINDGLCTPTGRKS